MRWVESSVGLDCYVGSKIVSRNLSSCQVVSEHGSFCLRKLLAWGLMPFGTETIQESLTHLKNILGPMAENKDQSINERLAYVVEMI